VHLQQGGAQAVAAAVAAAAAAAAPAAAVPLGAAPSWQLPVGARLRVCMFCSEDKTECQ